MNVYVKQRNTNVKNVKYNLLLAYVFRNSNSCKSEELQILMHSYCEL